MMRQIDILFARAVINGQAVAILNEEQKVAFVPMKSFHGAVEDTLSLEMVAAKLDWDMDWQAQVKQMEGEI